MSRLTHSSIDNFQVSLIAVGTLAAALVPHLFGDHDPWYITAVVTVVVGAILVAIFLLMRQRQRCARQEAIAEVRLMLQDQIKNQLSIIMTNTYMATRSHDHDLYVSRINETVGDISTKLDDLSEESLTRWQQHYNVKGLQTTPDIATTG
jgi:hypothetical protein